MDSEWQHKRKNGTEVQVTWRFESLLSSRGNDGTRSHEITSLSALALYPAEPASPSNGGIGSIGWFTSPFLLGPGTHAQVTVKER